MPQELAPQELRVVDHRLFAGAAPVEFQSTPNRGGALEPRYLVVHYTAGRSAQATARWLCRPEAKASAHLIIGADGSLIQLVPFNVVAWHAGTSSWNDGGEHVVGLNQHALGIELDNPGRLVRAGSRWRSLSLGTEYEDDEVLVATHKHESRESGWRVFPTVQLEVAFEVSNLLIQHYGLRDILGHDDVSPGRKVDPGPAFPMESFRGRLFGRAEDDEPSRFVTTTWLNIRQGPGTQHATILPIPLPKGTPVQVVDVRGSWRLVDVLVALEGLNDLQGWVHGRYLGAEHA